MYIYHFLGYARIIVQFLVPYISATRERPGFYAVRLLLCHQNGVYIPISPAFHINRSCKTGCVDHSGRLAVRLARSRPGSMTSFYKRDFAPPELAPASQKDAGGA